MPLSGPHRALVVTVVHHPQDSRIRHREIASLLEAGWQVTYAAPFAAHDLPLPEATRALTCVDLPRATSRRRLAAARAARRVVRRLAPEHDVVLVHDPELLLATAGPGLEHLVWDVHEDPAGALVVKDWLPAPLRRPVAGAWRAAERLVERRTPLLLAEHAYADRFRRRHTIVPNAVVVPDRPGSSTSATSLRPGGARSWSRTPAWSTRRPSGRSPSRSSARPATTSPGQRWSGA